jgi:hypothetical protein
MLKKVHCLIILTLLILFAPGRFAAAQPAEQEGLPKLIIFHSPSCHRCLEAKQKVLPGIQREFKDKVIFEYRDISRIEDYRMLLGLMRDKGGDLKFQIPLFYLNGKFLTAGDRLEINLRQFILEGINQSFDPSPGSVDLVEYFKSFVPAAVALAGLSDGINPCAFTVIVFFISFLALQGYRKRELFWVGAVFILSVFLTYLALGLGIFNFLYRFGGFWKITQWFNIIMGVMSLIFGMLAVYDFIIFKNTGSTENLILQLPKPVKEQIHKVVGFFYRKSRQERAGQTRPAMVKLLASALISGFLISLLEAVCTGQVYLPTITFVLKSTEFKLQALGYLLLYNLMFIVPLGAILALALTGATSSQFSDFLKKCLGVIKLLMAFLFFGLGVYLLWRV